MRLEWALYAINRSHWKPSTKSRIEPDCYLDFQSQSLKASSLRLLCKANSKLKKQAFFGFWNEKVSKLLYLYHSKTNGLPLCCRCFHWCKPLSPFWNRYCITKTKFYHKSNNQFLLLLYILCLKGSLWNTLSKLPRFWFWNIELSYFTLLFVALKNRNNWCRVRSEQWVGLSGLRWKGQDCKAASKKSSSFLILRVSLLVELSF